VTFRLSPPLSSWSNGLADPDLDLGQRHCWLAVDGKRAAASIIVKVRPVLLKAQTEALERASDPIGMQSVGWPLAFLLHRFPFTPLSLMLWPRHHQILHPDQ